MLPGDCRFPINGRYISIFTTEFFVSVTAGIIIKNTSNNNVAGKINIVFLIKRKTL